ncbi:MAG TPA: hypothetical protein VGN35_05385 [Jatrophihabitantaceae bacterium]|jgi:Tfp pilus assembly protein PilV|nr:hypothetical protein [Jatrophihabitantaceae bacterium]
MTRNLPAVLRARLAAADAERDAGFTILEVLVSFTLFVLVSVTATYGIFQAINASHTTQQRGAAAGIAQSYLAQAAANAATVNSESAKAYSASVAGEQFAVQRTITFSNGGNQCSKGASFTVDVVVLQAQTSKFLARNDSVVAC